MIHITPVNDTQEHEKTTTCKCHPRIIECASEIIVVHDAFDGRLVVEIVNDLLNTASKR